MLNRYPFSIQNGRQKFKMAATKFSFLTFPHQKAVISRASSRSPCVKLNGSINFSRKNEWRRMSTDLNPIDYATWPAPKEMVYFERTISFTEAEMKEKITECCNELSIETIRISI